MNVIELTCELIRRASITPDDAGCQAYLAEYLAPVGFKTRDFSSGPVTNTLYLHGAGRPHFMFLGHTDVVPPGPDSAWDSPPFEPAIRDGVLYGRGTADMKASVAAMALALEAFVREHPGHAGTVSLLLTSDEEGPASDGVRAVAPRLVEHDLVPDGCVIGEPSCYEKLGDNLRVGRRGSIQAALRIFGTQGHTAYTTAAENPAHRAGTFLAALGALAFDDGNEHFPPTRLQISNLRAGTGADNVTPGELEVRFNIRNNPNTPAGTIRARIESLLAKNDPGPWELDWHISGEPFFTPRGALIDAAVAACESELGITPKLDTGGGTSDGRYIAPLGVPVVELGPVNASIHKVNEHIKVADLERLPGVYLAMLRQLAL